MKVLHITNWYPSKENPVEGIFIKEQIQSLNDSMDSLVVHLNIVEGPFRIKTGKISPTEETVLIGAWTKSWFVKELIIAIALFILLVKKKANSFDIINFHIAYPLLTYWNVLKFFFNKPIVINEHWTIYKKNFSLPMSKSSSKKLRRVKKIFFQKIKLLTVSRSLAEDIMGFSGNEKIDFEVLPNIVNKLFFDQHTAERNYKTFFTIAVWRKGKRPFILLKAFTEIIKEYPDVNLIVGGEGEQINEMKIFVSRHKLQKKVHFAGWLNKIQVANYMHTCGALLHCSDFETFSVVCAEAISSGCPAIVSNLDAVKEFCHEENSIVVPTNDEKDWLCAMRRYLNNLDKFDRMKMKEEAFNKFSSEIVGAKYYQILKAWSDETHS